MPRKPHFGPPLFAFLRDLAKHNDRAWFTANKARYEREVKGPLLAFIGDFAGPLRKISPHFSADPDPVRGSMFRIHRDTRFSKDKSPYKTHASAHFRHATDRDVHGPGFYLHLEPGASFMGCGIWHPETGAARAIREAIATRPADWKRAARGAAFEKTFELGGESLRRPPRDFDPGHVFIEDLKRKDFIAVRSLADREILAPDFQARFVSACKTASPFMRFISEALELPF